MRAHPLAAPALFLAVFLAVYNYTLPLAAGIYIVGDLGGSPYITTYLISFFALGNALGVPLARVLMTRISSKYLLSGCLVAFGLCSCFCATAPTYPWFLFWRFVQGFCVSMVYPCANALFGLITPKGKEQVFTTILMVLYTIGPVAGTSFGGWIAYDYDWRWVLYLNLPLALLLALVFPLVIKEKEELHPRIFDGVGYAALALAVLALGSALTVGQELDWFRSTTICYLLFLGGVSALFFCLWSHYHPSPVLNFSILKRPLLVFGLFNLGMLYAAYFGMVMLLSLWLKLYVNYTPIWIAVLIGTMGVASLFLPFLLHHSLGRRDTRISLGFALVFLMISCFYSTLFNEYVDFKRIALSRIAAGFGLAFFFAPLFRLCFRSYHPDENLDVLVIFQVVRALSSGLGATLYIVFWQRREVFYHERLGEGLTAYSPLTRAFFAAARNFSLTGERARAQLDLFLERQANALALEDCFYAMGWIMVGLLVLLGLSLFWPRAPFCPED